MRCLPLRSCCSIFDLRTVNIIMGCINALLTLGMFGLFVVAANTVKPLHYVTQDGWGLNFRAAATGIYAMSIFIAMILLAKFCVDVLFIYGVANNRAKIIKGYFIMWIVLLFVSIVTFFVNVTVYSVGGIFLGLFYIGLYVCAALLSRALYLSLTTKEEV